MGEECDKRKTMSALLSLPIFGVALLIVWHDIKECTAQTDDKQCSTFLISLHRTSSIIFLWQTTSYGYLCRADIHCNLCDYASPKNTNQEYCQNELGI